MARPAELKCLFCGTFFRGDPRNARHQKYCSAPACRKASKTASHRTWLAKAENLDYFRGPENVVRVQAWRAAHPGYWRRPQGHGAAAAGAPTALQEIYPAQAAYSGERDRRFRPIVTAAHRAVLRG